MREMSQVDRKLFNEFIRWKNDKSMKLTLNDCIGYII